VRATTGRDAAVALPGPPWRVMWWLIGGVDRHAPVAGRVKAAGQELLEGALGERALVCVVAQGVLPVPG
jgi:hypothetical protein